MPVRRSPNGARHVRPQPGRNHPERLVAISWNRWSQSPGARRPLERRLLDAHPQDQHAKVSLDLRSHSNRTPLPTPVAAKAGPMPTHEGIRPDDCEDLQDRRDPSIQLDKEPVVVVCEPNAAVHLTPQNDQLMPEHRVLGFTPALRLE